VRASLLVLRGSAGAVRSRGLRADGPADDRALRARATRGEVLERQSELVQPSEAECSYCGIWAVLLSRRKGASGQGPRDAGNGRDAIVLRGTQLALGSDLKRACDTATVSHGQMRGIAPEANRRERQPLRVTPACVARLNCLPHEPAVRIACRCRVQYHGSMGSSRLREDSARKIRICRAFADVAQLVEHFTRNEGVGGSSPPVGLKPLQIARTFRRQIGSLTASLLVNGPAHAPRSACKSCTPKRELAWAYTRANTA
jgi:hypothetical protein